MHMCARECMCAFACTGVCVCVHACMCEERSHKWHMCKIKWTIKGAYMYPSYTDTSMITTKTLFFRQWLLYLCLHSFSGHNNNNDNNNNREFIECFQRVKALDNWLKNKIKCDVQIPTHKSIVQYIYKQTIKIIIQSMMKHTITDNYVCTHTYKDMTTQCGHF